MIQHIVRRGIPGSPSVVEKWLDDMANEHGWALVGILPPGPRSAEPFFVFRRMRPDG